MADIMPAIKVAIIIIRQNVLHGKQASNPVADDLMETIDNDLNPIITSFIARTDRRFDSGLGFYGWRDLRYFYNEYGKPLIY